MKKYILKNFIPLIIEVVFIVLLLLKIGNPFYLNFLFYLMLIIYFIIKKDISFNDWKKSLKSKKSWKNTGITILAIIIGFVIVTVAENVFNNIDSGEIDLKTNNIFEIILFAIQTIIFPPLAEETFYRKNLIVMDKGKWITISTLIFSSILYGLEHAIYPFGIFIYSILGIAFGICYIKHKDINAMMTAHFSTNLVGNIATIIMRLSK